MDATSSTRPEGKTLDEFFHEVKKKYPNQLFMADCSTVEEAVHADALGFDLSEQPWSVIQSRVRR
mgnify:CR=1 FL=1